MRLCVMWRKEADSELLELELERPSESSEVALRVNCKMWTEWWFVSFVFEEASSSVYLEIVCKSLMRETAHNL